MALDTRQATSTPQQRKRIVLLGNSQSLTVDDLRDMTPLGSLRELSKQEASDLIERLGGGRMQTARQSPYPRRQSTDATRMITREHVTIITEMMERKFGDSEHALAWLKRNFKVDTVRDLGTAERAGEVVAVLKEMLDR